MTVISLLHRARAATLEGLRSPLFETDASVLSVLKGLSIFALVLSLIGLGIGVGIAGDSLLSPSTCTVYAAVTVCLATQWLARQRKPKFATVIFVGGMWLVIGYALLVTGGVNVPSTQSYFFALFAAATFGGQTLVIGLGILTIIWFFVLSILQVHGILPSTSPQDDFANAAVYSLYVVITVAAFVYYIRYMDRLLRVSRESAARSRAYAEKLSETTSALEHRATMLQHSAEISKMIAGERRLDQLLELTTNLIGEKFGHHQVAIFLNEGDATVLKASNSETRGQMSACGQHLTLNGTSVVGHVGRTGEPRIALNAAAEGVSISPPPIETKSEMALPLKSQVHVFGVLDIQSKESNAFTETDVSLLGILAEQLAAAIENAKLLKQAQETAQNLIELDKLKSGFLANMSHELRTPLNAIIGFSGGMLRGVSGPLSELQKANLTSIRSAGTHLLSLISDILDFSKIEAGKMELVFEKASVQKIVSECLPNIEVLLKDRAIRLMCNIPDNLPYVYVDKVRSQQVLLNLLSNAEKFTAEGQIKVSAKATGRFVEISVSDTGKGIAPEHVAKLFQPFSQVDTSLTRETGGTGLGLSICKSLVEMHGGQIGVTSAPGQGSTFSFSLPIYSPNERGAAADSSQKAASRRRDRE